MRNFKKVLSMVLVLVMALSTLAIVPLTTSADEAAPVVLKGQGTAANPYLVGSFAELEAVKALTYEQTGVDSKGKPVYAEIWPYDAIYVKLTADIEVAADFQMTESSSVYEGSSKNDDIAWKIDGNGHTIRGLTQPFFATLSEVPGSDEAHEFRDLTLEGAVNSTQRYVGMLTGVTFGNTIIENVTVNGSVETSKTGGQVFVGGFIGYGAQKSLTIRDSVNNASVKNNSAAGSGEGKRAAAGGFVGILGHYTKVGAVKQVIEYCTNNGAITAADIAGGIVGKLATNTTVAGITHSISVYNNVNNGTVTAPVKAAIYAYATIENEAAGEGSSYTMEALENYTTVADLAINDENAELAGHNFATVTTQTDDGAETPVITAKNYTAAEVADAANAAAIALIDSKIKNENNTFVVSTFDELKAVKEASITLATEKVGARIWVELAADITLPEKFQLSEKSGVYGSSSVNTKIGWNIDGNGYSLIGTGVARPLFGALSAVRGGHVFDNLTLTGDVSSNERYVSAFAGATYGDVTFRYCTVNGSVLNGNGSADGAVWAGGYIGTAQQGNILMLACVNNADITQTKSVCDNRGGAAGFVADTEHYSQKGTFTQAFISCVNTGDIAGNCVAGGIVGKTNPSTSAGINYTVLVKDCVNTGVVAQGGEAVPTVAAVADIVGQLFQQQAPAGVEKQIVKNCLTTSTGALYNYVAAESLILELEGNLDAAAVADEANAAAVAAINAKAVHNHLFVADCAVTCLSCELAVARTEAAPHAYDNETCDAECNNCGATREVTHVFDNACDAECNVEGCGATRVPAEHEYDNNCDATCNVCGDERTPAEHQYDNACDADCNECGATRTPAEHVYDNACDIDCNVCFVEREPEDHVYDHACDADCNVCGAKRTVGEHVYDNDCDTTCNVCAAERTTEHVYDNACDAKCNVCEAEREVPAHVYDDDKDATCNVCGAEREIKADTPNTNTGDTTTKAPDTTTKAPEEEKKGCGSALNSTYAIIALVAVLGFAFVAKKREEN